MIYLDHHATTPCDPRVAQAMWPFLTESFGNPASKSHALGRQAADAVEAARVDVASLVGADPREIIFTSGATEALNLALRGIVAAYPERRRVVVSAFEHKAVLDTCKALEKAGRIDLVLISPSPRGLIEPETLAPLVDDRTLAVAVMAAQNEIGTVQPIRELGAIARARGAFFVCDAVQAAGRVPFDLGASHVDLAALTAHKLYGPKGVGALWVRRRGPVLEPLMTGGGQERGLRPGTLNVPGIVGFGVAARIARDQLEADGRHLSELRARMLAGLGRNLTELGVSEGVMRVTCDGHGDAPPRLPGNLHLTFAGLEGFRLLQALPELALSTGSACSSERAEASHVLDAMGIAQERRFGALRIGLGRGTTEGDVDLAARLIAHAVARLVV
jgi:cysteine desulfurase